MADSTIKTSQVQNNNHKNHEASQLADIKTSLAQFQSASSFQGSSSSPLLQSLLQLIQNIISQLDQAPSTKPPQEQTPKKDSQQEKSFEQPIKKDASNDELGPNDILGTAGDDKIEGTRNNDVVYAKTGDDRVYGRQGNDILSGQQGNDSLYGGQGNDTLYGGEGNDYLSGGSGKNTLFGGSGDDTLYHRQGSDVFDGGSGNDTARIRANLDDYTVTLVAAKPPATGVESISNENPAIGQKDDSKMLLTNKKTGQTVEVINVENFRFNDASLSLDEMKQRVSEPKPEPEKPKTLDTSSIPRDNLLALFGVKDGPDAGSVHILDKNNDGKLSVGDTAVHSFDGLSQGPMSREIQLTEANIQSLATPIETDKPALVFNATEDKILKSHVLPTHRPSTSFHTSVSFDVSITDNDKSGKVSAGDTLTLVSNDKGMEGTVISEPVTLTSTQAKNINEDFDERKELLENKTKWESSGLKNYVMTGYHEPSYFGGAQGEPPERTITVNNGKIIDPKENSFTIDDIFKTLENDPLSFASYNKTYGYPERAIANDSASKEIKVSLLEKFRGESIGAPGATSVSHFGDAYKVSSFESMTHSLEERLEYLDDKSFVSEELLEVGLGGNGLEFGRWNIKFDNGNFDWAYSDVGEAGKYNISGSDISLGRFDDSSIAFKVFPDQNAIEINGNRYIDALFAEKGPDGSNR